MKSKINYFVKILKILLWPVLFGIGQIFIVLLFTTFYNQKIYNNILDSNSEMSQQIYNSFIVTEEYQIGLNNYINDSLIYIILITVLLFLPIFIYKYKKYNIKYEKSNSDKLFSLIIPSVTLALLLNIIIINFNKICDIDNIYSDTNLILAIISSGIIGPLLEEFLFRGIIYNELKKFNSVKKTMWITIVVFALFHQSFTQIMYGFILGYLFTKVYVKTNNIIYPVLMHIFSNTIITIGINYLIPINNTYSFILIVLFFIIFYFSYKIMNKKI